MEDKQKNAEDPATAAIMAKIPEKYRPLVEAVRLIDRAEGSDYALSIDCDQTRKRVAYTIIARNAEGAVAARSAVSATLASFLIAEGVPYEEHKA